MKRLLNKIRKSRDEDDEMMMTNNAIVIGAVAEYHSKNQPRTRGSHPGRRPNIERHREDRGKGLMQDYFIHRSVYTDDHFRTSYRVSYDVFDRIFTDLCNHDNYFTQKRDAIKKIGLLPQQKITSSFRMLAYGASADSCDEICRMGKSTSVQCLKQFTRGIVSLYSREYLRAPNEDDLKRLMKKADRRGFPGMIGSIDYMHWQWKNCPAGYAGEHSGRKHYPTLILEAVASYDMWIWHAFFGMPGACNDLNVLAQSPLFDNLVKGTAPEVDFEVRKWKASLFRLLSCRRYISKMGNFCQINSKTTCPKEKHFSKLQEAYRKDVERCFGVLQSRFGIVRGAARGWDKEDLRYIMLTCIILHNMVIEDERPEDTDDDLESDEEEEDNMRPKKAYVWERPIIEDFDPVGRNGHNFDRIVDRYLHIRTEYAHSSLQGDLVQHAWIHQGNTQL